MCVYVFLPIRILFRPLCLEVTQVKSSGSSQLCSVPFLHFSFKHELRAGDANILALEGRRIVLHCLEIPAPSIIQDRSIHIPEREGERSIAEQATNGQLINCLKDYQSNYSQIDPASFVQSTAWNSPQPRAFGLLGCPVMLESDSFALCLTLWCTDPVAVGFL